MKKVKFRNKISILLSGIFLLGMAVLFEFIIIDAFKEEGRDGTIAIIFLSVFVTGIMAIGGLVAIYFYFKNGRRLKEKLKQYGKENILTNIQSRTLHVYRNPFTGAKDRSN